MTACAAPCRPRRSTANPESARITIGSALQLFDQGRPRHAPVEWGTSSQQTPALVEFLGAKQGSEIPNAVQLL